MNQRISHRNISFGLSLGRLDSFDDTLKIIQQDTALCDHINRKYAYIGMTTFLITILIIHDITQSGNSKLKKYF